MAGIILHHYQRSPFAEKVRLALGLKGLDYHAVTIPAVMPKPELMPLTGGYRRTPVLQVGADIYCDTLAILHQIERMHPTPSLYPAGIQGVATALGWWIEKAIFVPAVGLVRAVSDAPPNPALSDDRRAFFGFDIDKPAMLAQMPTFLQRLAVHLHWFEQMMQDGRNFLLGAEPSAADLAAFHPLWFIRQNGGSSVDGLLPGLASLQGWFERVASIGHGNPQELKASEALGIAAGTEPAELDGAASDLFGCRLGDEVSVTPDDTGRDPVRGTLLAASGDRVVLGRTDPIVGRINLHFPRAGFDVAP
jgi:glutathione S-transferase